MAKRFTDKQRLDWLEQKNAPFNQASILSKSSDGGMPYACSSGFHRGRTIRQAIDAAMRAEHKEAG